MKHDSLWNLLKKNWILRSFRFRRNLLSRCEKTDFGESAFFGILTSLVAPVSPFMIAHIV